MWGCYRDIARKRQCPCHRHLHPHRHGCCQLQVALSNQSIESGSKHLVINKRFFTLRYPEQKLKFVGGDVVAVKRYFANLFRVQ
jgi:hypothetical protein